MENKGVKKDVVLISDMKSKVSDILTSISWRDLARTYFGKSSSWFYHKMDGINGMGAPGGFTKDEAKQLKNALLDLSDRIRRVAEGIS